MSDLGQKIISEIRDLARDYPDFIATGKYVDEDGDPICIVGHALSNLGLLDEFEKSFENRDEAWWNESEFDEDFGLVKEVSELERNWVLMVQGHQDCNKPWSEAVEVADGYVR